MAPDQRHRISSKGSGVRKTLFEKWLAERNGLPEQVFEFLTPLVPDINMVIGPEQAGLEFSIGGDPEAIAVPAELGIMERTDYFDFSTFETIFLPVVHPPCDYLVRTCSEILFQSVEIAMRRAVVEVHEFDELEDKVPVAPHVCKEVVYLGLVDALQHNHVQLDGSEPGVQCCRDTGENLIELVYPGNLPVRLLVEAVEADIDPPETGFSEIRCEFRKKRTVCRNGRFNPRGNGSDYLHEIRPEKWFSSSKFDALDPEVGSSTEDLCDLSGGDLFSRPFLSFPVAVDAGEVALRREAHPQVGDGTIERIFQDHPTTGHILTPYPMKFFATMYSSALPLREDLVMQVFTE